MVFAQQSTDFWSTKTWAISFQNLQPVKHKIEFAMQQRDLVKMWFRHA